jgi:periplasmic copper chaperone A
VLAPTQRRRVLAVVGPALGSALAVITTVLPASAHDYKVGALQIVHPWSRATPGAARVGGGYLKIINGGSVPDRLLGGTAPIAGRLELHRSTNADGIASMRSVESGLEVRPGETVELAPGGVHLMLVDLKQPLKAGERIGAMLTFEKAGAVAVEFAVQGLGANAGESGRHDWHGAHRSLSGESQR